jgi:hypothetical protein
MFRKNMLWMYVVMLVIVLVLGIVGQVHAEDETVPNQGKFEICKHENAVNFPGYDVIKSLEDAGFTVVDDGSCYYLQCDEIIMEDGTGTGAYSCDMGTPDHENFYGWVNGTLLGMENNPYPPSYYGKLIDTGGCTDPLAENWMNPIWFPDYNIIDNDSCTYPEPENAL